MRHRVGRGLIEGLSFPVYRRVSTIIFLEPLRRPRSLIHSATANDGERDPL
jgi:hypothetical protein